MHSTSQSPFLKHPAHYFSYLVFNTVESTIMNHSAPCTLWFDRMGENPFDCSLFGEQWDKPIFTTANMEDENRVTFKISADTRREKWKTFASLDLVGVPKPDVGAALIDDVCEGPLDSILDRKRGPKFV